ncbi:MAG: HU family DNA-binding protein [Ignavibacteria bacterium]|nr:HU family DNA-binding protein [Ignavibacteria bacterium]
MALNKQQLVAEVAKRAGIKKLDAEKAINATIAAISDELAKGGKVTLVGFGTFSVIEKKERTGINPRDPKKTIKIPARKAAKFKPGKTLRDKVNVNTGGKKKGKK